MVGFDRSDQARDALKLGTTFADIFGAQLVVAVVNELHVFDSEMPGAEERAAYLAETLELAAKHLDGRGFQGEAISGSVPQFLELIASHVSADVIVVGSTHRGGIGRVVPGSAGERLLAGAPCPIAIAPNGYAEHGAHQLKRIGVGVDSEEESKAALRLANGIATASDGSIRLIAVAPLLQYVTPGPVSKASPGYVRFARGHFAEELKRAKASSSPSLEVTEVLGEGDPAQVLCEQSSHLDLLVLGSRGYGPLRRVFLGGVASKVIRGASCPVLITPRSAEGARHHRAQETLASTVL